ncbi:MAG: hypothetical protein ACFFDP_13640, partial [Promethearchaeota archaeon]
MRPLKPPFALALFSEKRRELAARCIVFRPKRPNLPLIRARIWFHMVRGRLRPEKLWILSKNHEKPIDPHSFFKWIRNAEYIAIPRQPHLPFLTELKGMLRDYNVADPIIVRSCKNCAADGRLTMLRKRDVFTADGEALCYPCALRELSNRFRSMDIKISRQAHDSLEAMLKRLRSVDKVAWFLSSR